MNVILEGQLTQKWTMREVLQALSQLNQVTTGILRIACPPADISGRIAISGGTYITGARIAETDEHSYPAVRRLLSLREGNFAFLDTGGIQQADIDQSLHIGITRILALMPNLPESPAELFDEQSLLDQVFGGGQGPDLPMETRPVLQADSGSQPQAGAAQAPPPMKFTGDPFAHSQAARQAPGLEPSSHSDPTPLLPSGAHSTFSVNEGRITFGKLKALAYAGTSGKAILLWLVLIAVVAAAALAFSHTSFMRPPGVGYEGPGRGTIKTALALAGNLGKA